MERNIAALVLLSAVACSGRATTGDVAPSSGGSGGTASGSGGTSGGQAQGGTGGNDAGSSDGGSGTGAAAGSGGTGGDGQQACGAASCPVPQICCIATGNCFDPSQSPAACSAPQTANCDLFGSASACGSDADCASEEFCRPELGCAGPGCCIKKAECPAVNNGTPVCGCDGHGYADWETACESGVPPVEWACGSTSSNFPSGGVACGASSAWCPQGQECCPYTGVCYDPSKPDSCRLPPPGTAYPCMDNVDCEVSLIGGYYCLSTTCGAPGGCVPWLWTTACASGVFDPVCGCDGKTYVNAECAQTSGVSIDYAGECTDGSQ